MNSKQGEKQVAEGHRHRVNRLRVAYLLHKLRLRTQYLAFQVASEAIHAIGWDIPTIGVTSTNVVNPTSLRIRVRRNSAGMSAPHFYMK